MTDILNNLEIAKNAALEAGRMLFNFKDDLNKENISSGKDIKLKADMEAEKLIKEYLLLKSDIPILGEETGASVDNLGKTFWVVDPLDGTANYSRNIPICCVSIALISNLEPVIGVIYDFNNDDIYEGSIESEAKLNNTNIYVNNNSKKNESILLTGLPLLTDYSDAALLDMVKDFQLWKKVRMIGSAAMAAAYVASAKADMYKEQGSFLWDIAAGAAIVNAAGGCAKIINQKENYQVDVVFSNKELIS
jgi:myo-inositol-1(or 4)-monophosphatase